MGCQASVVLDIQGEQGLAVSLWLRQGLEPRAALVQMGFLCTHSHVGTLRGEGLCVYTGA